MLNFADVVNLIFSKIQLRKLFAATNIFQRRYSVHTVAVMYCLHWHQNLRLRTSKFGKFWSIEICFVKRTIWGKRSYICEIHSPAKVRNQDKMPKKMKSQQHLPAVEFPNIFKALDTSGATDNVLRKRGHVRSVTLLPRALKKYIYQLKWLSH